MLRQWPFAIAVLAGLLWVVAFVLSCKFFGLPLPRRELQRKGVCRKLSANQYACLFGALSWGIAMFVSSVVDDYLRSTRGNTVPIPYMSVLWMALEVMKLAIWLGAGCLFGWIMWGGYRHSSPVS
jgi:hypothetical protein